MAIKIKQRSSMALCKKKIKIKKLKIKLRSSMALCKNKDKRSNEGTAWLPDKMFQ